MDNNNYGQRVTYGVDLVFCIDATGSMTSAINMVKDNALKLYEDVRKAMAAKNKEIESLRVRVIAFRDYVADGDQAMLTTDFFALPAQNEDFKKCVNSIVATGGGDEPEDGLEALGYAIRSKWSEATMKKRQVIVVWTDASTHDLGFGKSSPYYPQNMAKDFQELSEWWGDSQLSSEYIDRKAKRLVLFAPDKPAWNTISDNWDNVIHYPAKAGAGLSEMNYQAIISTLVQTI